MPQGNSIKRRTVRRHTVLHFFIIAGIHFKQSLGKYKQAVDENTYDITPKMMNQKTIARNYSHCFVWRAPGNAWWLVDKRTVQPDKGLLDWRNPV